MPSKKNNGTYAVDFDDYAELPPGEALKDYLIEIYDINRGGFAENMDYDLSADGELKNLIYDSAINYLIRRLVTTMEFIHRSNGENTLTTRGQLKNHLDDTTRFTNEQQNKLVKLLIPCLETARDDFKDGDRNYVKKQAKLNQWSCFVCGKEMIDRHVPTADHLWPRTMGGLSMKPNLRLVCAPCNNDHKKNYIGSSDYHYEEIAVSASDIKHYKSTEQPKWYEIAIFAKSDYKCTVCEQPAYRVGELFVGRKNPESGWHYLNLAAYCYNHKPE